MKNKEKDNFTNQILKKIKKNTIKVGIIGLGYVGLKLQIQFAQNKIHTFGFDKDKKKIFNLKKNLSPISYIKNKELQRSSKFAEFYNNFKNIKNCDIIIICLPTPLTPKYKPDLTHIKNVMIKITKFLRIGQTVILESTTYPGTTNEFIVSKLKKFSIGKNFFVGYSPERENPGSKNFTFYKTPKIVSGYTKNCLKIVNSLYSKVVEKTVISSEIRYAETAKIFENIYRAVNIALVNEMKFLLNKMNMDVNKVIDLASTKPFGFSEFRPGPGVGGHCIPIDPLYLAWVAKKNGFDSKFIKLASNININTTKKITDEIIKIAKKTKTKKILIIGLSYKKNIEDKRESASIKIFQKLLEKKYKVSFIDHLVKNVFINGRSLKTMNLNYKSIKNYQMVILGTDHDYLDYAKILKNSNILIDLRNRYKFENKKIIKL